MISISDMSTIKYWQKLGSIMDKSKEKISKECRIGDTYFTSFATIGGHLYTRHANNFNHVHRETGDLLSVIIILGTDFNGGESVCL